MFRQIIHSDNCAAMDKIILANPHGSIVDVCVTSPPYKDSDGYTEELMTNVFTRVYRLLRDDGLFFLNFGHLVEDKFRPFRVCQLAMDRGFHLVETITWVKNHYSPIQGHKRLNNLTEFVFLMAKNPKYVRPLDRLSIGVPYADKSNVKRFAGGVDLKCAGNVWYIPYDTIQSKDEKHHNDRFPLDLPMRCLKLSGVTQLPIERRPAILVFDPFSGSGTTCRAAKTLNCDFIGIEKNIKHVEKSKLLLDAVPSPV